MPRAPPVTIATWSVSGMARYYTVGASGKTRIMVSDTNRGTDRLPCGVSDTVRGSINGRRFGRRRHLCWVRMLGLQHVGRLEVAFFVDLHDRIHHHRVKLGPPVALELLDRLGDLHPLTVGPVGDHRIEGVHHSRDPRPDRDLLPLEPLRVAGAIKRLLVVAH